MAGQFRKFTPSLWMLRFHGRCACPVPCHVIDAVAFPATAGESGLTALKLMVAGAALTATGPHAGVTTAARRGGRTGGRPFGPIADNNRMEIHVAVSITQR